MTKKTIYAVNRGCYSDYSVTALFSDKADALRFMQLHPDEGYSGWNDIEEYTLDSGVAMIRKGFAYYMVQMREDGSTFSAPEPSGTYNLNCPSDTEFRTKSREGSGRWFNWYGWARDAEHATKSANEHRVKLLASAPPTGVK